MTAIPPVIPLRVLGRSGMHIPALGVGTNRWGLRGKGADVLIRVFSAALDAGANLFDTAEVYIGSEKAIGECRRRDPRPALVVSKFAPYPTRLSSKSFHKALEGSLTRLRADTVDLYLIHFPFSLLGIATLMDRLAEVARAGKVLAVGVSNFSARQMYVAAERLERHGIPLAANEVQFSLFHRDPERNGVLEACRKLDVALIAYRPLGAGGGIVRTALHSIGRLQASPAHDRRPLPKSRSTGCCAKTNESSPFRGQPASGTCAKTSELSAGRSATRNSPL